MAYYSLVSQLQKETNMVDGDLKPLGNSHIKSTGVIVRNFEKEPKVKRYKILLSEHGLNFFHL